MFSTKKTHKLEDFDIVCEKCGEKVNVWTHSSVCPHPTIKEWLGDEPPNMDEINKKKK